MAAMAFFEDIKMVRAVKASTKTKLINIATNTGIVLSDGLYPNDEHDWSTVVSNSQRTLTGNLIVQQSIRIAGKPITLQSPDDMGWLSRQTVNNLKAERDKLGAIFWLDYLADDAVTRVKVAFDHNDTPITAKPVKGYTSPALTDPFIVTLKFITVE